VGACYNLTVVLQKSVTHLTPAFDLRISFEYGIYTISAAGMLAGFSNFQTPSIKKKIIIIKKKKRTRQESNLKKTFPGACALAATASNLLTLPPVHHTDSQAERLVDDWDGLESFSVGSHFGDTPLDSIPPPPYTP
jgi:hypothetical protein